MTLINRIFSFSTVNMLNAAVPFLLLPLLTSRLSTQDYGLLSIFQLYAALLIPLVTLNFSAATSREYFNLPKNDLAEFIGTILFIPFIVCFMIAGIVYVYSSKLQHLAELPLTSLIILPFFVAAQYVPLLVMTLLQSRADIKNFASFKLGIAGMSFLLTIAYFIFTAHGWYGRVEAIFFTQLLFSVVGLVFLKKTGYWQYAFKWHYMKSALHFSLPLIPHTISGALLSMADRIILAKYMDMSVLGIYSVAFQISSILAILMASINQAWSPHLFNQLKDDNVNKSKIVRDSYMIIMMMFALTVIFVMLAPLAYRLLVNERFHDGLYLVKYIAMGFLFQGVYFIFTNYIFYARKTMLLSVLTVSCAVFNIVLSIYCVKVYGAIGATYSMAITWIIFSMMTWVVSFKCIAMPWLNFDRR